MHIADGFLSAPVAAGTAVAAIGGAAIAAWRVARDGAAVVGVGMMAAFLFVAQVVNFPVVPGASGHLLGAGLAVAVLGLTPGMLAMIVVVVVQALFFRDGGISAMGANALNMAVAGPLAAWCVLRAMGGRGVAAVFLASAAGMFVSAGFCALQLVLSGTVSANMIPLFMGVQAIVAVCEGIITAAVATAMTRHGFAMENGKWKMENGTRVMAGAGLALLLLAPFACAWPDGLEYVAERWGFAELETEGNWLVWEWLGDYGVKGLPEPYGVWLAVALGACAAFLLAWGAGRVMKKIDSNRFKSTRIEASR